MKTAERLSLRTLSPGLLVAEEQLSAQPIQVIRDHLYRSKAKAVNNTLSAGLVTSKSNALQLLVTFTKK